MDPTFLKQIQRRGPEPIPFYCDNQGAIRCAHNPMLHRKMKHIDIILRFVKLAQENGIIDAHYVHTKEQVAGIFRKPLIQRFNISGRFWVSSKWPNCRNNDICDDFVCTHFLNLLAVARVKTVWSSFLPFAYARVLDLVTQFERRFRILCTLISLSYLAILFFFFSSAVFVRTSFLLSDWWVYL